MIGGRETRPEGPRRKGQRKPLVDTRDRHDMSADLWLHREVIGSDIKRLRAAAAQTSDSARPKLGDYSLTLLYPADVLKANRLSGLGYISDRRLAEALRALLPASLEEPVVAQIGELGDYGKWIGAAVTYPELEAEHAAIFGGLNTIFGIECEWTPTAHISIAEGSMDRLRNAGQVAKALPDEVLLAKAL